MVVPSSSMINANLRFPVDDGNREEIVRTLRAMIERTRVKNGCIACRLYYDVDDPNLLTWVEEWESREDLERHVQSPRFRSILAALDMCSSQPEIRFDTVIETDGMQLIADTLGKS